MNLHKNTRLTPIQRKKVWQDHSELHLNPTQLAQRYRVSRPTIYKILKRARLQEFQPRRSVNRRFRCLKFGCKRLARIERKIEERLRKKALRYNKKYPGELIHFDTKRLPLLKNESKKSSREYLFVGIDDYSRELFATILPDKTQFSSAKFLRQVVEECPYSIEIIYSDNGTEYRGTRDHEFVKTCRESGFAQRFTRVKRPQTNGKAERVIRTLMEMWHAKIEFKNRKHRKKELIRFLNFYNTVKPHKGIDEMTPHEKLIQYFYSNYESKCK